MSFFVNIEPQNARKISKNLTCPLKLVIFLKWQKLSNKKSAEVIYWFHRLRTALNKTLTSHMSIGKLIIRQCI